MTMPGALEAAEMATVLWGLIVITLVFRGAHSAWLLCWLLPVALRILRNQLAKRRT
jgi:hypothetical protein